MELQIHGYELTLRLDDAAQIEITPAAAAPAAVPARRENKMVEHPGLGEGGRYHTKQGEHPLPEGKTLTFALAGNQNCGKTTLFNQLTGSNQHVATSPASRWTGRAVPSRSTRKRKSPTCPASTRCRPIPARRSSPASSSSAKSDRHHQHRGRDQHRAQPVPDDAAHGAGYPHGAGPEHDGRGARQRRHHPHQPDGSHAGHPGGAHLGG